MTYLFLSFNSDFINTVVFPKISQFGRESAFFLVIFGKLLRACFIVLGPAKLKIVRVRSVLNDVSVPFASCPPNWRHSEYYSCQTVEHIVSYEGMHSGLPVFVVGEFGAFEIFMQNDCFAKPDFSHFFNWKRRK